MLLKNNSMLCADNKNIRSRLSFVPYGSVLEPMPGKVVLDVGNRLCPGIIDHHQPGVGNECAASLILQYPHYILEYLKDIPVDKVIICTHFYPDLDAVTSAYFCHFLLLKKKFPPFAAKIAAYVRDVDQGICFRNSVDAVTIYSIFTAMCELIGQYGNQKKRSKDKISRTRMECGFSLLKYATSKMKQQTNLHDSGIFTKPHPFDQAHNLINQDYNSYLKDIKQCKQVCLTVPHKDRKGCGVADTAIIENPRSLLFRSRARADKIHSSSGKGFSILVINYDNKRYVISADPQTQFYLKGLGELLEEAEKKKRKALGMERQGKPRPGYSSSDPWYDGRNSLHNYTIIDTPRNGTLLTWDEIQKIVLRYGGLNQKFIEVQNG